MTEKALIRFASLITCFTLFQNSLTSARSEVSISKDDHTAASVKLDPPSTLDRKALRLKLEKDRLTAFMELIATIEKQDVPFKLLEMVWTDGLEDGKKKLGIRSADYRAMLAKCAAFYQSHNLYEKAENLYVRDMQDLVGFKSSRFDDLKLLPTKRDAQLLSDDMLARATIIDMKGKRSREALEQRKQALALLDRVGIPVELNKRAILAHGFVIAGDDNSARKEYQRYTREAREDAHKFAGLVSLARLEARQKHYELSLDYYTKVQKLLNGPPMTNPFYPSLHLELARLYAGYQRKDEAEVHYKLTLSYMEIKKPPPSEIYAAAMNELGSIYRERGNFENYLKCVARCVNYVSANPDKIELWYAINPLLVAAKTPNIDGRPFYEQAMQLANKRKTKEGLLRCMLELATYEQREDWPTARERYQNAIALARKEKLFMFPPLRHVGGQEYVYGNYKGALALYKEAAVWIKGTEYESMHPEAYADLLVRIANCYASECNFEEMQKTLDEFYRFSQSAKGFKHDSLVNAMFWESQSQMAWLVGDNERMRACFEQAERIRKLNGIGKMDRAKNIINHMRIMHVRNANVEMEPTLANALIGIDAMKKSLGPYSAYRAMIEKDLAQCYESAGKIQEADVVSKRAEEDKKALLDHFKKSPS